MSQADRVFIEMCKSILNEGNSEGQEVRPRWEDRTPAHTVKSLE